MSSSRDPLVDPQPGDVVGLWAGWERTVRMRTPRKVWFDSRCGNAKFFGQTAWIAQWRLTCTDSTVRVIRRGEAQ